MNELIFRVRLEELVCKYRMRPCHEIAQQIIDFLKNNGVELPE